MKFDNIFKYFTNHIQIYGYLSFFFLYIYARKMPNYYAKKKALCVAISKLS